ncbi:hypothetical protein RB653_002314 [Dictyostelium firmibasis]|uniref:Uncharacterized protein n=1 Tax=Dictyostelium firmibasis TaxID=79012 RepID=A0AAN7TXK0_9MYCE
MINNLILFIIIFNLYIGSVYSEIDVKWNNCQTENCSNNPSHEVCLSKLFEGGSKYSYLNIPDYPNNVTVLNKLYTFTYFENEKLLQVSGGYNTTKPYSTNYTYPFVSETTNLYEDETCIIIDQTECYLAVVCNINDSDKSKRLAIALGLILPILALIVCVGGFILYKRYKNKKDGYLPASTIEIN